MSTVSTWTDFFLGTVGLNLLNELHSYVDMELNVALFAFLCLPFWMDGILTSSFYVCIQIIYLLATCVAV